MDFMVVDPNIAFATLLEQELVRLGHRVVMCTSGGEALALARREMPDLVLLDMALEGPDAPALGRQLRELDTGVRLVLIPMIGDDPLLDDDAPSIQGILTKPFFVPELPDAIRAALEAPLFGNGPAASADLQAPAGVTEGELDQMFAEGQAEEAWGSGSLDWLAGLDDDVAAEAEDVAAEAEGVAAEAEDAAPAATVPAGAEMVYGGPIPAAEVEGGVGVGLEPGLGPVGGVGLSRRAFRMNQGRIETAMRALADDVGADGVLLTSDQGLLTSVGNLDESEIELISAAVLQGVQTSAEVARILGREQLRFEQSIAGGSYILYALSVHDAILAVTVSGDARLGLLRLAARAAAELIAALCVAR